MSAYWKRLKRHPGVPIASFFSVTGAIPGLRSGSWQHVAVGVAIMSVFWIPVLITARASR